MCRDDNAVRVGIFAQQVGDQYGMSKGIRVLDRHLDDIAGLYLTQFYLMAERARPFVGGEKVPEIGNARPGGRAVVQ